MSSLQSIRLNDGSTLDISEWLHDPLFSTADFTSGDQWKLDLFSYTTSGTNSTARSTASAPLQPSPTTSRSSSCPRTTCIPRR